jgi:DNA-binding transcriptional LysR family regulator
MYTILYMEKIKDLTLMQIELVAELPKHKGIRDIARRFNFDPTLVSRKLKDVENTIGQQLFTRSATGIVVNDIGKQVSALCSLIISHSKTLNLSSSLESNLSKYTTLSAPPFLSESLSRNIVQSSTIDAGSKWKFLNSDFMSMQKHENSDRTDFVFHTDKIQLGSAWKTSQLKSLNWALVARNQLKLTPIDTLVDLKNIPFLVISQIDQAQTESQHDLLPLPWNQRRQGHVVQSLTDARAIIMNSDCLALMPLISLEKEILQQQIQFIKVKENENLEQEIYLSYHIDRVSHSQLQQVMQAYDNMIATNERLVARLQAL